MPNRLIDHPSHLEHADGFDLPAVLSGLSTHRANHRSFCLEYFRFFFLQHGSHKAPFSTPFTNVLFECQSDCFCNSNSNSQRNSRSSVLLIPRLAFQGDIPSKPSFLVDSKSRLGPHRLRSRFSDVITSVTTASVQYKDEGYIWLKTFRSAANPHSPKQAPQPRKPFPHAYHRLNPALHCNAGWQPSNQSTVVNFALPLAFRQGNAVPSA